MNNRLEIAVNRDLLPKILGANDSNLRLLEKRFNTGIAVREASILVEADESALQEVIRELVDLSSRKEYIDLKDIETVIRLNRALADTVDDAAGITVLETQQVSIKTRSVNQTRYVKSMEENELVFSIGPAGTGKTFLAVAKAVSLFQRGEVERIILVRPAVEAGEKLGFLPGDIREKLDPYFRPLYDALLYMLAPDKVSKFMDQNIIEISPLAYMRGRTLSNAVVILDEAQNITSMQMKMFLTRLGLKSRAVVTGDLTQIDLEKPQDSGLLKIQDILRGIKGIEFIYLEAGDVVRHRLVSDIVKAYDKYGSALNGSDSSEETDESP